jgi:hypothetical protein
VQQVAPIAEAKQQVARVGKCRGHGLQLRLEIGDRDANVDVPPALDHVQGEPFGGSARGRRHRRACRCPAAAGEHRAGNRCEERRLQPSGDEARS